MARRDARPRDTKEKILAAALAEFTAQGYADASIDEIAARAGVTKGAVYYWFRDKADLARDLRSQLADRLAAQAVATIRPEDDALTNVLRGFEAWVGALQAHDEARFFLRDCWAIPELSDAGALDEWARPIRDLLAAGIERGDLIAVDADALAIVLIGALNEATLHVLRTGEQGPTVEVLGTLLSSLAAKKTKRRART